MASTGPLSKTLSFVRDMQAEGSTVPYFARVSSRLRASFALSDTDEGVAKGMLVFGRI